MKLKNRLWTFGCSFTAEYDPIGGIHPPFENNFDKYYKFRGNNFPDTWTTVLANKIGYEPMNCAFGGSSNYGILNQFIDVCDLIKKDDILIFGWTHLGRFIAVNNVNDIFNQVLPFGAEYNDLGLSKKTVEEIQVNRTNPLWGKEVYNWIYFINRYAKNIGAESYHWTSDERIFDYHTKNRKEDGLIVVDDEEILNNPHIVDKHNLLWYLTHPAQYNGKQMGKVIDETDGLIADGHLGEWGHKVQTELFYRNLKERSKITIP